MGLFSVKGYQLNAAVWVGGMLLLTGLGLILSQAGFCFRLFKPLAL